MLVDPDTLDKFAPVERLETKALRRVLVEVLATLPDREREIVVATEVSDPPATHEGLGVRFGVSNELIRQLRERGLERLRAALHRRGLSFESLF